MTFKSRAIAIVAATLAISSVGSAFAQDRFQQQRGPDRDGRFEQRDQRPGPDNRGFDRRGAPRDADRGDGGNETLH